MTPEAFFDVVELIPDGMVLLSGEGRILAVNRRARARLRINGGNSVGRTIAELTDDLPGETDEFLRLCRRSRDEVVGGLRLRGQRAPTQVLGRLLKPGSDGADSLLMLRIPDERGAINRFTVLNQKIDELSREIARRRTVEAELRVERDLAAFGRDIGVALARESEIGDMLQRCVELMVHHLDAAFARIWLVGAGGEELELMASAGIYTHLDGAHSRIRIGQYKIGLIAREQKPHLTNSVVGDERVHDQEWARREGMVSFAGYPLIVDGRTLGVMAMFARHEISESTVAAMASVANSIALGVERKAAEWQLARANTAALAANAAKSEFLANMSHEIRTPLTAILGYADILRDQLSEPDKLRSLETIRRNGRFLLQIVNDILDLSKVEAGKLAMEMTRVRPNELVADVLSLMEVRAREKQLPLLLEFDGPIPETINSDPIRLRQILVNLLGNAIKFTDTGSVRLVVKLLQAEEKLQFDVIDTGIGISSDQQAQLFEPFTQADSSVTREYGGSGLGLAISRRLAEALGGEIRMQSTPGRGSVFTLTVATDSLAGVPLVEPDFSAPPSPVASVPMARLSSRVLIVDDRREVRYLAQHFVEEAGGHVLTASNGKEALERLDEARSNGSSIDLVLMDIQMPLMDGYETTKQFRSRGYRGPIIALTAHAMQRDRDACLQAGCDAYLSKPLDREKLIRTITQYTMPAEPGDSIPRNESIQTIEASGTPSSTTSPDETEVESSTSSRTSCRVLIVDDSPDLCDMLGILLRLRGHEVQTACSGAAAIDAAHRFTPDVVLLDLALPDMSGDRVARRLQATADLQHTVFIAVSGCGEPETARQARDAGFHHFVLKPADVTELEKLFPARPVENGAGV